MPPHGRLDRGLVDYEGADDCQQQEDGPVSSARALFRSRPCSEARPVVGARGATRYSMSETSYSDLASWIGRQGNTIDTSYMEEGQHRLVATPKYWTPKDWSPSFIATSTCSVQYGPEASSARVIASIVLTCFRSTHNQRCC